MDKAIKKYLHAIVNKKDFAKVQDILARPKELSLNKPIPTKISNSCKTRIASGERKSSAVPYGYSRDENGVWMIAEYTVAVVQGIYEMALQGLSTKEICDRLHEAGYPTPSEQRKLDKINNADNRENASNRKRCR